MRFDMYRILILLILNMFSQALFSETFNKLWGSVSYFGQYKKTLFFIEPQIRMIERRESYDQSLFNLGIGRKVAPGWQIWFGQTYINYSTPNNIAEDVENVVQNEYRIWEQVSWHRPFWDHLASRTRIEQRRAFQSTNWALRFRERAFWAIPMNQTVSIIFSDELFLNLKTSPWIDTTFLDQNRLFIGIFYKFSNQSGIHVSYMNQYIHRNPQEFNNGLILNWTFYGS